jgi:phage tail sheath protein FI
MTTLVSPGVTVPVIDDSFYIPVSAPTVPLFFIATRAGKFQPNGLTPAAGTNETSVVRTVTSLGQSAQLYGIPYFWKDASGNAYHGDARNEYGLFALNQYLGVGNRAFVVRANIDLTDAPSTFIGIGTPVATTPSKMGVGNGTVSGLTVVSPMVKLETFSLVATSSTSFNVIASESGLIGIATVGVPFTSNKVNFTINQGTTVFVAGDYFTFSLKYAPTSYSGTGNGSVTNLSPEDIAVAEVWTVEFTSATDYIVSGSVSGPTASGTIGTLYSNGFLSFVINAGTTAFTAGDTFTFNLIEVQLFNPLGANDAAKRLAIRTALQAEINSNTEVRSEIYEFNLIVCPGYPEVVDEMLALSVSVNDEAFVIADTPCDKSPEEVATWANTSERFNSTSAAYYYPWGLASNLDGADVVCAPSGIALRTYAYSDSVSEVWFAPAGVRRGLITGVSKVGYVTGSLGTPTTFVETNLNQGQRDNLYEFYKNINPFVYFPGRGLLVWGQKTAAPGASALDRVNVVRLIMEMKRGLRKGSFPFVFEPNDQITRDNLKAAADGYLNDILVKRGLYDFVTLCDESNNIPTRIDRNEMWLDVAIKPMKVAEFIYIPIRVVNTGASLPG